MEATVKTADLKAALSFVGKAADAKNALPVLAGAKLEAAGGSLRIAATDLEVAAEASIPADVAVAGAAVARARQLADLARLLPAETVRLALRGDALGVEWDGGECRLPALDPGQYPLLPGVGPDGGIGIGAAALKTALRRTAPFASKDLVSAAALSGVLFEGGEEGLTLVATDTHRLAVAEVPAGGLAGVRAAVPARALALLAAALPDGGAAAASFGDGWAAFAVPNARVSARLLAQPWPDWRKVVPELPGRASVPAGGLAAALERCLVVAELSDPQNCRVRLAARGSAVEVSSEGQGGRFREAVPAKELSGDLGVQVNARYVLDALAAVRPDGGEEIEVLFGGPEDPLVFRSSGCLHMVLPIVS